MDGSVWLRKVNLFLLAIPAVLFADRLGIHNDLLIALLGGLALIPLAGFVESAVEELAELLGPFIGGLLHTTFGNVAELFIGLSVLLTFPPVAARRSSSARSPASSSATHCSSSGSAPSWAAGRTGACDSTPSARANTPPSSRLP